MSIKLTFLGAAQNVTGSRYLLEVNRKSILVDCGMYQERDFRNRNWDAFPVRPHSIDAVLLTHAHADHCGLLPRLAKQGFKGPVYCTRATAEIARIVLEDAGGLNEDDARFKERRHKREGRRCPRKAAPLFTARDARDACRQFKTVRYSESVSLGDGIEATFFDAGHILGSAMIEVRVTQDGEQRTILFSGDVGRWDKPILRDPTTFDRADYVVVESTYGDRQHEDVNLTVQTLAEVINETREARGNVVIPSFAIERSQELLFYLHELLVSDCIPHLAVFVDSPMAIEVTEVFEHHPELFDEEMMALIRKRQSPFDFPGLKMCRTIDESKAINHIGGTVIIIAGAGMCTGGRIKHHLAHNIWRSESTILFVGYQAQGTLGREIVDGARRVRVLGETQDVNASVVQLDGFSAHADRDELLRWLSALKTPPRRAFVTHGEPDVAQRFGNTLEKQFNWDVTVPQHGDSFVLD